MVFINPSPPAKYEEATLAVFFQKKGQQFGSTLLQYFQR